MSTLRFFGYSFSCSSSLVGRVLWAYLILWIALPAATTTAEKLAMRGEEVTVENIKKAVEQEAHRVKRSISSGHPRSEPACAAR